MKLLSIDQSLLHSAFAVFEDGTFKSVFSWKVEKDDSNDVCYEKFYKNIKKVILKEKPDIVICEKMFLGFNAAVYGKLSELTGMIRAICIGKKIPFEAIHISSYRAALGIKNNKEIAQQYIKSSYPEVVFNNDDETDAVALSLGYLIMKESEKQK
jgi:Holliday junction resolvasome RuvABC endonuclease subunit